MSWPALRDVRRIAVFRPNAVGDFMFSLPALHALRATYREAEIVYLGRQWHRDFLAGRPGPVDRVVVVPPMPGLGAQEGDPRCSVDADLFIGEMRDAGFDIALQMFGGGRFANPLVGKFGARLTAGMRAPDAAPLDRCIRYGGSVNRRLQLLEVATLAGARAWPMSGSQLAVTAADRLGAAQLVPGQSRQPMAVLQPGASDTRRQWPASRFAAVGDALAGLGAQVVVNGSLEESTLVREVVEAMRHDAINLSGRASLSTLCGLLERAVLVVSNDTGPLHMALALGRPCVGIYWLTSLIESAPLTQHNHRAAISVRTCCPVCGVENIAQRCAHDVRFVDDVPLEDVAALAVGLFKESW